MKYIFNTKFACDEDKNGQEVEVVKDYHNGQIRVRFENGAELDVYNNEISIKE